MGHSSLFGGRDTPSCALSAVLSLEVSAESPPALVPRQSLNGAPSTYDCKRWVWMGALASLGGARLLPLTQPLRLTLHRLQLPLRQPHGGRQRLDPLLYRWPTPHPVKHTCLRGHVRTCDTPSPKCTYTYTYTQTHILCKYICVLQICQYTHTYIYLFCKCIFALQI